MQLSGFFIFWTEGPILYSRAPVQNSKSSMIPTSLRCGDTWSIEIPADENYPNSEYTPHLRFIGPAAFTLDAALNTLIIAQTPAQSKAHPDGIYNVVLYWTKGTDEYTTTSRQINLLPNLRTMAGGFDARSSARQMLDAIEEAILSFAGKGYDEREVAARRIHYRSWTEMLGARSRLQLEVQAEEQAANLQNGIGTGRTILTRRGNP